MRSISIYALTRNQNTDSLSKLERQLSGREYFLKIREWELQSMKALVRQLESHMTKVCSLRFFYSYQIPKLGKEFDLLQIKDDQIINIELKSGAVSEEAIRKQLMQNRYYLSVLIRISAVRIALSGLPIMIILQKPTGQNCADHCKRRAVIIRGILTICFRPNYI